ncbi:MAG: DUF2808 domain-containing protein [Cyanobacteria bacterium J083]|nr:MAG: DUF2808 domain-containing protein [Cyanobacteria bacterium J083]
MFKVKFSTKPFISTLAIASCLLGGTAYIAQAQSNPGLTIFSGIERENILSYYLDFGGKPGHWDRYRLEIPAKKLTRGAAKIFVTYPDYYKGKFKPEKIEVRIKGEPQPLREVIWDKESRIIEMDLENPIPEGKKVEIVMSEVKNPRWGGTFYFHCQVMSAGDIPIREYLGSWILSINR